MQRIFLALKQSGLASENQPGTAQVSTPLKFFFKNKFLEYAKDISIKIFV